MDETCKIRPTATGDRSAHAVNSVPIYVQRIEPVTSQIAVVTVRHFAGQSPGIGLVVALSLFDQRKPLARCHELAEALQGGVPTYLWPTSILRR